MEHWINGVLEYRLPEGFRFPILHHSTSPSLPSPMKMSDLKDRTLTELLAQGRDMRQEIFNQRLQQASSQLEKPGRLRSLRRDVARIETQITMLRKKAA